MVWRPLQFPVRRLLLGGARQLFCFSLDGCNFYFLLLSVVSRANSLKSRPRCAYQNLSEKESSPASRSFFLSNQRPHRAPPSHPARCACSYPLQILFARRVRDVAPFRELLSWWKVLCQLILSLSLATESNSQFLIEGTLSFFITLSQVAFMVKGSLSCIFIK